MNQMEMNHTKEVQSNEQLGPNEVHVMGAEHDRQCPIDRRGTRRTHVEVIDGGIVQCTID